MCSVHEDAHGLNDDKWVLSDGPLHDGPAQELFLKLQQLHDDYCVHVDVKIPDAVQESFNDFFFARDRYSLGGDHFSAASKIVITVTPTLNNGKKYTQGDVLQPLLTMVRGNTYVFDTSDSTNAGHPLLVRVAATEEAVDGLVLVGSPGSAGSTTTFTVPMDAPDVLTYYCTEHVGMGNTITVSDPEHETIVITVTPTANDGKKYTHNDEQQPVFTMVRGSTYVFDTSHSSNDYHPLSIRVSSTEAIDGVVIAGAPGHTGSSTTFTVPLDAPDELTYYCIAHANMGATITVVDAARRVQTMDDHDHDMHTGAISYDMACTQTYPGNPRLALQMSLYCLLGHVDKSLDTSIVHRDYGLSPTCDTILRHNMRNQVTQEVVQPPRMYCESDAAANTCTVQPVIRTDGVNSCDKYCAQFDNTECKSASVNSWIDQCTELRPWTCSAPAMDTQLLCTCGEVSAPFVPEEGLVVASSCAKQLLPSDYPPYRFCDQDLEANTCTTQSRLNNLPESSTCTQYCAQHELECVAAFDDMNCIGTKEYDCDVPASSYMLCTCAEPATALVSNGLTTPNCDSYCQGLGEGQICLSASSTPETDCMVEGNPCYDPEDFATQLEYVCGADVERPELVDEMATESCAHMMFYRDPVSRPSSFCPPHTLAPDATDSCTVLANMSPISSVATERTCRAYCESFSGMTCVGAAEEVSNDCNVKQTLTCDESYSGTSDLLCACAIDTATMPAVVDAAATAISPACENMMMSPSRDTAKVTRVCESFPDDNTCTTLAYVRDLPERSCNEFCSSFHDMQCVGAASDKFSTCNVDFDMSCDSITTSNDLLCTCGFKTNTSRSMYFDMAPVFEKNAVRSCPAYETATNSQGNEYHTNENDRKYTMIDLTLDVDEVGTGAATATQIKVRPDQSNSDRDTYNTAHVEACDGFESQIRAGDAEEKCSFGHRLDKTQNCYGKVYGQNYHEAASACAERGGHIVKIDDAAEYDLLKEIFGNQAFNVGLHDVGGRDWEWNGFSGESVNPYVDNGALLALASNEKEDCVSVNLGNNRMTGKYCYERETYMCEGIRDPITGMGGDLMADEGGFCLWYLDDPTLELPDDEDNGFTNTELAHHLLFDEDKRTRKYIELYDTLYPATNIPGHAENEANWEDFTYRKLGINSDEPLVDSMHHNKSYHCHFSPTNFGIARIYIQQHMLERIYPGSMHKHCFCGYKHLGHFVDRCDCTRSGERNGQCQKHHREQLWTETYHQTGEYVYCNNGNCEGASP